MCEGAEPWPRSFFSAVSLRRLFSSFQPSIYGGGSWEHSTLQLWNDRELWGNCVVAKGFFMNAFAPTDEYCYVMCVCSLRQRHAGQYVNF